MKKDGYDNHDIPQSTTDATGTYVYIVRSGLYDGNIGMTTWINVRVFASYELAEQWIDMMKAQDSSFNENFDFYDIEQMVIYDKA